MYLFVHYPTDVLIGITLGLLVTFFVHKIGRKITEKKKNEKRIEFQANNDFLTGLYNRMRCEADLYETITEAVNEGKSGYIMFIDLDNFKHINDGLGHQYGDILLKMISLGLQQIKGIA